MASFPLPPGSTIGILGGGQLGRMLALAAARLGFDVAILTPEANSPASRVAARTVVAAYDDLEALAAFARKSPLPDPTSSSTGRSLPKKADQSMATAPGSLVGSS